MVPKRGVNVMRCETARFLKLTSNSVMPLSFIVPRKSDAFQEDLYPDTQADVPALTADEWWSGSNADPILVPMTEAGVQSKKVRIQFIAPTK